MGKTEPDKIPPFGGAGLLVRGGSQQINKDVQCTRWMERSRTRKDDAEKGVPGSEGRSGKMLEEVSQEDPRWRKQPVQRPHGRAARCLRNCVEAGVWLEHNSGHIQGILGGQRREVKVLGEPVM